MLYFLIRLKWSFALRINNKRKKVIKRNIVTNFETLKLEVQSKLYPADTERQRIDYAYFNGYVSVDEANQLTNLLVSVTSPSDNKSDDEKYETLSKLIADITVRVANIEKGNATTGEETEEPTEEVREWVPYDHLNPSNWMKGDLASHNGVVWESLKDNNEFEPSEAAYMVWKVVKES